MKTRIALAAVVTGGILAGAVAANALSPMAAGPFVSEAGFTHAHWRGPGRGPAGMMMPILREADANDDGAITQAEIDAWVDSKVAAADADGDGNLSLAEFEAVWLSVTRPRMVDAFQALDEDGDATVTAAEVDERVGGIVARMDRNDDGQLDRDDRGRGWRHGGDGPRGER